MTSLDAKLANFAIMARLLSQRSLIALFYSCSEALLPQFRVWASRRGQDTETLLRQALSVASEYVISGVKPDGLEDLLAQLEASTPESDSPDRLPAIAAQDCWICADICIRVLVDPEYDAGPALEYALQPVLVEASERLFGVSQVGSGPDEERQVEQLLKESDVSAAIAFLEWALRFLRRRSVTSWGELTTLKSKASTLAV